MTLKQDLATFKHQMKGYSVGNSQDRRLWAAWKRFEARVVLLDRLYQEVKHDPGSMPTPESCHYVNELNGSR